MLKPLESLREHIVVVSGLANKGAENLSEGGGVHTRVGAAWLSGIRPKKTEGADIEAGTSIDQMAAAVIGQDTPLNSLQMALDYDFVVGSCENGYSCVYQRTFSWKTPTMPMPMESNPRAVFERMFGEGGTAAERFARMRQDRSILDLAVEDMARLTPAARRRRPVDGGRIPHRRSRRRAAHSAGRERQTQTSAIPAVEQPVGIPDQFDDHARLMLDLNLLAFQADVTRVVAFQFSRELSGRPYPWIGVPDGASRRVAPPARSREDREGDEDQRVSRVAVRLSPREDEEHARRRRHAARHSIMMYGAGMGDSDHHTPVNIPTILAGGGRGELKGGRHLVYPENTPMTNLGLTILDKVGRAQGQHRGQHGKAGGSMRIYNCKL